MLDAILSPACERRSYSFNAGWADGEEMASMRNGSGDEYSIVFQVMSCTYRGPVRGTRDRGYRGLAPERKEVSHVRGVRYQDGTHR